MKLAIGADHRGFALKEYLMQSMIDASITWVDAGCNSALRCDFPPFAQTVAKQVQDKSVDAGILICGSGIGMSIAANRYKGIYAALAWNVEVARSSKEHDNANILVLPADYISLTESVAMVKAWKKAQFLGNEYLSRLKMIDK